MAGSPLLVRGEMELGLGQGLVLVALLSVSLPHEGASQKTGGFRNHFPIQGTQEVSVTGERRGRMATTSFTRFPDRQAGPHVWNREGWRAPQGGESRDSAPEGWGEKKGRLWSPLVPQSHRSSSNGAVKFSHFWPVIRSRAVSLLRARSAGF